MRTLAQRLDSGTATLYRHFDGRDDLVARVVDTVMAEVRIDAGEFGELSWQQACATVAHRMFDVLRRHPNVAALMVDRVPVGPQMITLRERALQQMLDSGFPPRLALQAWATIARYVLGFGTQLVAAEAEPQAAWADVELAQLPATMAVAEYFPMALETEFEFGLSLLISGLERQLGG